MRDFVTLLYYLDYIISEIFVPHLQNEVKLEITQIKNIPELLHQIRTV